MNDFITDENIRLLQAMQLPLVALIILLCLRARIPSVTRHNSKIESKKFILSVPLKVLGFGLMFNVLYLLLNMKRHDNLISLKDRYFFITLFNSLTTFFLYTTSLAFYYIKKEEKEKVGQKFHFIWTIMLFGVTALVFLFNMWSSVSDSQKHTWTYYIYDFGAYFSLSYFTWKWSSKSTPGGFRLSYFMATGFFLWSLLQVGAPLCEKLGIPEKQVQFWAFAFSTAGKIFILYGLFSIYKNITGFVLSRLQEQKGQLEGRVDNLEELQALINEVSSSRDATQFITAVKQHFIHHPIFDFDYMIFSKVDYLDKKINYVASDHKEKEGLEEVDKWVLSKGISIYHHDIMAVVVAKGEIIHVYANVVDNVTQDLNDPLCPLNKEVYTRFRHQHLNRYFIPVLQIGTGQRRELRDTRLDNKVVAMIELGYFNSAPVQKPEQDLHNAGELNIYIDNCAQVYRRILNQQMDENIEERLKVCDSQSNDDHKVYMDMLIKEVCEVVKADSGVISIFPYFNFSYKPDSSFSTYNTNEDLQKKIAETFSSIKPAANSETMYGEALSSADLIRTNLGMHDSHGEPIKYDGRNIGYVYIFSRDPKFLNQDIRDVVHKMFAAVARIYIEKKFHYAVSELVIPDNTVTDPRKNIQPVIQALNTFFSTSDITVWLRSQKEGVPDSMGNRSVSIEFREIFPSTERIIVEQERIGMLPEFEIIQAESPSGKIYTELFLTDNPEGLFRSMIYIPLRSGQQLYGFITVQFRNQVFSYQEDLQFLKIIANKAANTILLQQVVVSFQDISSSFKLDELDVALNVITDRTMNLLNADSVILFKSENGKDVYFRDMILSFKERFIEEKVLDNFGKSDDHVDLAEVIISGKITTFTDIDKYTQYRKNRMGKKANPKGFWERESIKASIAMPLISKADVNRSVGVVFVNYKRPITFSEEVVSILETFGTFAAGIIHTGFKFEVNKTILLSKFKISEPAMNDLLAGSVLHDAKRSFKKLSMRLSELIRKANNPGHKGIDIFTIRSELNKTEPTIEEVNIFFNEFDRYYKREIALKIEPVNIIALLDYEIDSLKPMTDEKNIQVETHYQNKTIEIECDKFLLHRVFQNLIVNACQAMEKRGILEIRAKDTGEQVSIDVIDNGEGIDKYLYDFITLPYITTRHDDTSASGSGLGLAVCKLTIEKHGGKLKYTSKDKRTVFTVILPKKQNQTS